MVVIPENVDPSVQPDILKHIHNIISCLENLAVEKRLVIFNMMQFGAVVPSLLWLHLAINIIYILDRFVTFYAKSELLAGAFYELEMH